MRYPTLHFYVEARQGALCLTLSPAFSSILSSRFCVRVSPSCLKLDKVIYSWYTGPKEDMAPYQYKREPLSEDESQALVNACASFEEKLVIWTLLDTGLRVSEFAALSQNNVQWQERRLVIHGKSSSYRKRNKRRVIPLTERVHRLLEYHFAEHDGIGKSKRTIQRIVKRVANRTVIAKPVTPQVLRHTFAVTCLKKGVSPRAVQTLLGHDRLIAAELYLNQSPEVAVREFLAKW